MQYLLRGHHIIIHALTNLQSGKEKKKEKSILYPREALIICLLLSLGTSNT